MDDTKTILFTVGPVEMEQDILNIGAKKLPYCRTEEFSKINLSICENIKKLMFTEKTSRVALLTCSGSGAMEASVLSTFTKNDKVLIIDGGDFGKRFRKICEIHDISYTAIELDENEELTQYDLDMYKNQGYSGLLINAHETSIGKYYDMKMVGEFCKSQDIILVVDAISTFLADEYYMDKWNIDETIISSQKALALPPGMSIIIVNEKTYKKICKNDIKSLYFNLMDNFENMERGQTPFTPAIGILIQLYKRLNNIMLNNVEDEIKKTKKLAEDFRKKIIKYERELPVLMPKRTLSNAITPLSVKEGYSAIEIVNFLKDNYGIYVCSNGGALKERIFRVGHIGNLTLEDNSSLIQALMKFKETKK